MAGWETSKHNDTSARVDVTTVLFCSKDNMCMLRVDLHNGKCLRCGGEVQDVTNSPVAQSWLALVHPYPKKKGEVST